MCFLYLSVRLGLLRRYCTRNHCKRSNFKCRSAHITTTHTRRVRGKRDSKTIFVRRQTRMIDISLYKCFFSRAVQIRNVVISGTSAAKWFIFKYKANARNRAVYRDAHVLITSRRRTSVGRPAGSIITGTFPVGAAPALLIELCTLLMEKDEEKNKNFKNNNNHRIPTRTAGRMTDLWVV